MTERKVIFTVVKVTGVDADGSEVITHYGPFVQPSDLALSKFRTDIAFELGVEKRFSKWEVETIDILNATDTSHRQILADLEAWDKEIVTMFEGH